MTQPSLMAELSRPALFILAAGAVFAVCEKVLPDVVGWVSAGIEGTPEGRFEAKQLAIGLSGLIAIGTTALAARATNRPFRETNLAILASIALTTVALARSTVPSELGYPAFDRLRNALYIVFALLSVLTIPLFDGTRRNKDDKVFLLVSICLGAVIGFAAGQLTLMLVEYLSPQLPPRDTGYLIQTQAIVGLSSAWGCACFMMPPRFTRHTSIVWLAIAAVFVAWGYGGLIYDRAWPDSASLTKYHLGLICMLLCLPSTFCAMAVMARTPRLQSLQTQGAYKIFLSIGLCAALGLGALYSGQWLVEKSPILAPLHIHMLLACTVYPAVTVCVAASVNRISLFIARNHPKAVS